MTLYTFKPRFQAFLRPRTAALAARGVTANHVTVGAAAVSVALGAAMALGLSRFPDMRWVFLLLPVWFLIRMALNAIDGMLAREFGHASPLGAYLNEIGDLISDAALLLPFAFLPVFGFLPVASVVVLALIAEFAGAMGPAIGAGRRYDGPMGKSDRALVFGALALWIGIGGAMPSWMWWMMPVVALLLVITIANRISKGLREARARGVDAGLSGGRENDP